MLIVRNFILEHTVGRSSEYTRLFCTALRSFLDSSCDAANPRARGSDEVLHAFYKLLPRGWRDAVAGLRCEQQIAPFVIPEEP
jgi:hypothetical protein